MSVLATINMYARPTITQAQYDRKVRAC